MPWIFVNGSNLLDRRARARRRMDVEQLLRRRPGGRRPWRWLALAGAQGQLPANVEALDFMVQLYEGGHHAGVELGGGETLQGFFTSGKLAMTPAGGFWAGGLNNAGMENGSFDVQLFPKWKNQRHQFGTGGQWLLAARQEPGRGVGLHEVPQSQGRHEGNGMLQPGDPDHAVAPLHVQCRALRQHRPGELAGLLCHVGRPSRHGAHPGAALSNPMTTLFATYTARAMTGE